MTPNHVFLKPVIHIAVFVAESAGSESMPSFNFDSALINIFGSQATSTLVLDLESLHLRPRPDFPFHTPLQYIQSECSASQPSILSHSLS